MSTEILTQPFAVALGVSTAILGSVAALRYFGVFAALRKVGDWSRSWDLYVRDSILLQARPGSMLRGSYHDEWRFVCPLHGPKLAPGYIEADAPEYEIVDDDRYTVLPVASGIPFWTFAVQNGPRLSRSSWLWRCFKLAVSREHTDPELQGWFLC